MKKILSSAVALLLAISSFAQGYAPTTIWPYVYEHFTQGTIYTADGTKFVESLNVNLTRSKLHYLDNEIIKEVILSDAVLICIGEDRYIPWMGRMYRIVYECAEGLVLVSVEGDFSNLNESGGAYGSSSSTSATTKLTSLDGTSVVGQNHMILWQARHNGTQIAIRSSFYVKSRNGFYKAGQKDIRDALTEEKAAEWTAWLKDHKIKWKNPESIAQALEFLNR